MPRGARTVLAATLLAAGALTATDVDVVVVRVPLDTDLERCDGCGLVRILPDGSQRPVAAGFAAAKDPAVARDGRTLYFSARPGNDDRWQIWRVALDGGEPELVIAADGDAIAPILAGSIFHLEDEAPVERLVYLAGHRSGMAHGPFSLHAANLDGTLPTRLSFHPGTDRAPDVLANGRLVFVADGLVPGTRSALMAVNLDGADLMSYADPHARSGQLDQVAVGPDRVWFVVTDSGAPLHGGRLGSVTTRRPLRTTLIRESQDGLVVHSPRPLGVGALLASVRRADDPPEVAYRLARIDAESGRLLEVLAAAENAHLVDAQPVVTHPPRHGRSSVVDPTLETGVLYCLSSHLSDRPGISEAAARARRVRVLRGRLDDPGGGSPPQSLGEAPLAADGSFHLQVPARTPLQLELLDESGDVVAAQRSWIWVMPRERRGCIGCHEDREMAPPNRLAEAVVRPAVDLTGAGSATSAVDAEAPR